MCTLTELFSTAFGGTMVFVSFYFAYFQSNDPGMRYSLYAGTSLLCCVLVAVTIFVKYSKQFRNAVDFCCERQDDMDGTIQETSCKQAQVRRCIRNS